MNFVLTGGHCQVTNGLAFDLSGLWGVAPKGLQPVGLPDLARFEEAFSRLLVEKLQIFFGQVTQGGLLDFFERMIVWSSMVFLFPEVTGANRK